jgi:hypothetical protein
MLFFYWVKGSHLQYVNKSPLVLDIDPDKAYFATFSEGVNVPFERAIQL